MAIAFVQQAGANATGSSLTISVTTTAGNFLVVSAAQGTSSGAPAVPTSVTDTASNAWTQIGSTGVWYVLGAAAVTSITVTWVAAQGSAASVMEFSGVASAVDVSASASGTSTAPASGSATTTNAADLLIGAISATNNTGTAPVISGQTAGFALGTAE